MGNEKIDDAELEKVAGGSGYWAIPVLDDGTIKKVKCGWCYETVETTNVNKYVCPHCGYEMPQLSGGGPFASPVPIRKNPTGPVIG